MAKAECGWCGEPMGERDGFTTDTVTHGICPKCMAQQLEGEES